MPLNQAIVGKMDLISKKTRYEFREWLVIRTTLREIEILFDSHDIECVELPPEKLPRGLRRNLVERYYASLNWNNPRDVRKVLGVYEDILAQMGEWDAEYKKRLIRFLQKDGFSYENLHLIRKGYQPELSEISSATEILDVAHLEEYVDRIKASIDTDPALAIGSTKEMVESTLKTILTALSIEYNKEDDTPKLLKKVQKVLELAPKDVDDKKRGADIIRRTLSNLGLVVVGIAELRNLYGTGHGHGARKKGLTPRHARLIVSAGASLCTFLLETYEARHR